MALNTVSRVALESGITSKSLIHCRRDPRLTAHVADVDVTDDAKLVAHELAHILGSEHRHCYAPEVDQCYSQESGCYGGTQICPATGRGTTMSYCNFSGCRRPNLVRFSPRVRDLLRSAVESAPTCFAPIAGLFGDDFESRGLSNWN